MSSASEHLPVLLGSGEELLAERRENPTVTLVARKADHFTAAPSFVFMWIGLAPHFTRFESVEHQNTTHNTPFHLETLKKLHSALSDPIAPKMTAEDDRFLRWLGCKDAKPYQLYSHDP